MQVFQVPLSYAVLGIELRVVIPVFECVMLAMHHNSESILDTLHSQLLLDFTHLAAILCILSIVCISLDKCGSHAEDAYFSFGQTTPKKVTHFTDSSHYVS